VRIQTLWRLVHAKKRVRRLKKLHSDARLLTRRLHRLCKKHRFHIKYIWEQQRTPYVVRMQALMRGAVARMRHARLLSAKRKGFETNRFITTRLNQLLAATQLQLIRDSMTTPIGTCIRPSTLTAAVRVYSVQQSVVHCTRVLRCRIPYYRADHFAFCIIQVTRPTRFLATAAPAWAPYRRCSPWAPAARDALTRWPS
jgi:hypothetical protein